MIKNALLILLVTTLSGIAYADDDYLQVRSAISRLLPGLTDVDIRPAAIEGLLEVRADSSVFYVSGDGEFLLNGPLYGLQQGENYTEKRLAEYRKELLDNIPAIQPIEYHSDSGRHRITVVTDIDCPYCRRMHQDMPDYNAAGLDIDYLMMPRAGKDSASYVKTVNAVCAARPDQAITSAMSGINPEPADCQHQIDQHMAMARSLGVNSTPNIVLPDGTLIRGYQTVEQLNGLLEKNGQE